MVSLTGWMAASLRSGRSENPLTREGPEGAVTEVSTLSGLSPFGLRPGTWFRAVTVDRGRQPHDPKITLA